MALPQLSIWQPGDGLRKIKYKYHVCLIVIFSVLIRLLFLTDRYLWCDEASSVLISRHSVDNQLFHAAFDVHPPLYYLLLHDWIILLGDSIAAVRSLSLLFGILTVVLVIALTRWLANERTALLAGWFAALMPMAVHYSQETRMYALMGMLTLAAALALMMWIKTPTHNRYLVAYALLMTFSFYTHYFTLFTLIAHWIAVTILSCQSHKTACYLKLPGWWFANLAIAVAYLPWLPVLFNLLTHLAQ
ncbi:TPA: glycosyltransferase family 39 protein, partial [Salmonella enterica subsp. enterica serovar Infantis]|nr:glycosyltransferase family 39 protein [Salmonella enterica subsp. enterica serovar Infantis]